MSVRSVYTLHTLHTLPRLNRARLVIYTAENEESDRHGDKDTFSTVFNVIAAFRDDGTLLLHDDALIMHTQPIQYLFK